MRKINRSLFVKNIIRRRKNLGWTQADLAEQANMAISTLKNIELGKSDGWPGTKEAIARALGCSIEDLYMPERPRAEDVSEALLREIKQLRASMKHSNIEDPLVLEGLELLSSLDREKLAIALDLLRSLGRSLIPAKGTRPTKHSK